MNYDESVNQSLEVLYESKIVICMYFIVVMRILST